MSELITWLLKVKKVAIIGGGKYDIFQELFIRKLKCPRELLKNLFLFPTTATSFYRYNNGWKNVYAKLLTISEKNKIKIARLMAKKLPNLKVVAAGFTTIDVTRRGIDKAYGIHQIQKHLRIPINNMFFIGDAIFPGGNDYAIVKTGVDYAAVKGPAETKKIILQIL